MRAAGITSHLPLSGEEGRRSLSLVDDRESFPGPTLDASFRRVSPGYFEAMAIPLRRGRAFRESETGVAVVAYGVARRRHEIGVRMAVGADATDVVRLVVGQGLRLVLAGVAVGLAGVLALTRVLRGLLYEVSPLDAGVLVGVVVLLALTSLTACSVPARRASRLDPLGATRVDPP